MRKIGRNDPCPCGSGKKYKKCCLALDEANLITRLTREEPPTDDRPFTPADIDILIEESLTWDQPSYREIARDIAAHLREAYGWDDIASAIVLWHAYCYAERPVIRKKEVFLAAVEYCIALINGRWDATQEGLADKYGVSAGSVSKRAGEIMNVAEYVFSDEEDDEEEDESDFLHDHGPATGMSRLTMEKMLRDIEKAMAGKNFASPDEANAYLQRLLNDPVRLGDARGRPSKKEQAQDLLYEAWETPNEKKRIRLALQALKLYPDSPDAYNILAESARTPQEARDYYLQGMKAGERDLGTAYLKENKGHFWGLVETRPFMRAKKGYAETCELLGDLPEAVKNYEEMLELNPNDNQGIRYMLLGAYCELNDFDKADQLLKTYPENTAFGTYDRLLVEFGLHGITEKLKSLLQAAKQSNPHVLPYLTGKKRIPSPVPGTYIPGDESEAVVYADARLHIWKKQKPLNRWIADQK